VILLESTSHLFSNYHRTKLKKRAFSGLLGILSWWWIAALSLRFMDALAIALLPSLSEISLFETLSFSAMWAIGLVITMMADLILFLLIGLIYLVRHLVLYLFVLMMPILIVLWIPGIGPFTLVSRFMKELAGFYVPFLFMSIPVTLLFRLGGLLGHSIGMSGSGIGAWPTALVIPFAALMSPFVLFWQAGALLFMADRAASHASADRASRRYSGGKESASQAHQGGRNFVRGVRNEPAVRNDGQTTIHSGDSSAHAAGRRTRRSLGWSGRRRSRKRPAHPVDVGPAHRTIHIRDGTWTTVLRRLLAGATLVALAATLGSLYFSEVAGYPPCDLCWYQRILMYPLVVVLGVAAYEARAAVWKTGLPLSGLGVVVAGYHTVIQATLEGTCTVGGNCTAIYWSGLGAFTIPRLSLLAFALVTAGLVSVAHVDRNAAG